MSFNCLELMVREAKNSSHQNILRCYIHAGLERAKSMPCCCTTKAAHMRIVNTLVETMCDSCIAMPWRKACFKAIKQYMPILHVLLNANDYQKQITAIQQLSHYFLGYELPANMHPTKSR